MPYEMRKRKSRGDFMTRKHLWKKTAALVLALGLTVGATGCNFFVADNVRDLEQVVATVDISDSLANKDKKDVAAALDQLVADGAISTDIYKRELVSLFLSSGYSYVQQGYSYKDVFNMLMDSLTGRKVLTQYVLAHYIEKGLTSNEVTVTLEAYKAAQLAKVSDAKEKELLEANPEVLTMKYYLTNFGKEDEESLKPYFEAEYGLKSSLNSSLDSAEANYIKETTEEHSHENSRTTPTKANATKADYVPMKDGKLDYDVYTGRNALDSCGQYEKVKGSTKSTRMKAYNVFLSNLQSYGLVEEGENASNITKLNYYYEELSATLGQALVNKYYDELQKEAENSLTAENVYKEYKAILANQQASYEGDYTAFEGALDKVSDTSFLLYGLDGYGYVYNILLPFSQKQTQDYSAYKKKYKDNELYKYREELLANIEAKDLREAWF